MYAMKKLKSFMVLPSVCWVLLLIACKDEEVIPQLPILSPLEQLDILFQDSTSVDSIGLGNSYYYFLKADSVSADTGNLEDGTIIYFHYSLSFLEVGLDSINIGTDSVSIDTVRRNPIIFQAFDFTAPSSVARIGVDAIWPAGLDQAFQQTNLREGETYYFYMPPKLSYGNVNLEVVLEGKPVEIGIRIDSIKNLNEVIDEARINMIQYINDAELRDTSVVPGGPVSILTGITGDPVYFKRLGPAGSGLSPLFNDSVRVNLSYRFVTDSLNNGDLGALENPIVNDYSFLVDAISTIQGLQTGILSMRTNETALMMFGPELAYREGICFIPGLRQGSPIAFYGRETDDPDLPGSVKSYLRAYKKVPNYAFQTEPYRSYIFEVTLNQVY